MYMNIHELAVCSCNVHSTGLVSGDEYSTLQLSSLSYIATIGVGGFGRVELVRMVMKALNM